MKLKCILTQETASLSILPWALSVYWVSVLYKRKKTSCICQNLPSVISSRSIQALFLWQTGHGAVSMLSLAVAMGNFCSLPYNDPFSGQKANAFAVGCPWKYQLVTKDADRQNSSIIFANDIYAVPLHHQAHVLFITTVMWLAYSPQPRFPFTFAPTDW